MLPTTNNKAKGIQKMKKPLITEKLKLQKPL